jgi:Fe-S cluster assembly protein SufD
MESDSHLVYLGIFDNSQIDLRVDLLGNSARGEFFWIFLGNVHAQFLTSILSNSCFAHVTLFCIVWEGVEMYVDGNIVLGPSIESSEWHLLEEQFLLWTPKHLLVRPVLDVRSYRVKASHAAKIHTLDKNKLFYMMAKWLSLKASQKIVVEAVCRSLFDRIPDVKEKDRILDQLLVKIFPL